MTKIIGMTYDLKADWSFRDDDPKDANAELDSQETVDFIAQAIEAGGHAVKRIGNARSLLSQIDNLEVDIVFNICEGYSGRNRESQVPVLLEMFNIPYIGSDGLTLGVTLDKPVAKKCFISDGIPTPWFFVAGSVQDLEAVDFKFPLMVKTSREGTSKGITEDSRVTSVEGLKRQVELITRVYRQPALIEQFINGTEFTVPVLGNESPEAMPVIQVTIDGETNLGEQFYTFDRIFGDSVRYACPAQIPQELSKKMQDLAVKAYQSVGCRDLGRVDFRVDESGKPYVLEINPLPSLAKNDVFNIFPQVMGLTYADIVNRIINFGLQRYGMDTAAKEASLIRK